MKEESQENFVQKLGINGEREIPGRQKVVYGSNVPVLTSHVSLNPRSKSDYECEARFIKRKTAAPKALRFFCVRAECKTANRKVFCI